MTKERLYLFDTTLRDGAQTQGVDFSVEDKRLIAGLLDGLGLDYIEAGFPGANRIDSEFFSKKHTFKNAKLTAFGMTRRAGRSLANDPVLAGVLNATSDAICLVAKSWDYHVEKVLGVSNQDNLDAISDSIQAVVASGREAMMDAEGFFDGYKANPDYALTCLKAALDAGARWVVLCDTNGGTLPHEIADIVTEVAARIAPEKLGVHCHNDTGNAVANTLAAIRAGVRQVQGCLNGLGERCGNTDLVSIIPTLLLKGEFADKYEIGVGLEQLKSLSHVSRVLDEILNRPPNRHAPYVGASAFAHKGGIHVSAVAKDPKTYEHVAPETVGNSRKLLVSDQAGKASLLAALARCGIEVKRDDKRLDDLLATVKEREFLGFSYDGAEASFSLLARRALAEVPDYFDVTSFRVMVERRYNALGEKVTISEAIVKIKIGEKQLTSVGEGNGPIQALDNALRMDLGGYSKYIEDLELIDYKVRVLTSGTGAITRVLVESRDKAGARWFTVGLSENIVEASFQALMDSIIYKLVRDKAPVCL